MGLKIKAVLPYHNYVRNLLSGRCTTGIALCGVIAGLLVRLRKRKKELFGSTEKRGRLKLSLSSIENLQTGDTSFKPHRDEHRTNSKPALKSGDFIVRMPAEFASLFELSCLLGGFGGRSRRGFGAVMIQGRNPESDFPGYLRNALANYLNNESLQIENYGGRAVTVIRFPNNEQRQENQFPHIKNIFFGAYDSP